ncbi:MULTISPECIES: enoyl-CoA hydratase/isomerase family protein [Mesobacillus]|uniref:Enoyl-CoA hydratase/carnithine racemase n=1 Tax=Mesobacillus stamsii TaxID=225347 RepID=A0ABU0FZQ6_9BACI|nr:MULTISPECIES: enoyl-CoA hydratase/isomerase family protein [Mesobacillus]MDQ0415417.1 enoyl-CoA hydratase/carnithine racemase [Mesobacillus stamsii]
MVYEAIIYEKKQQSSWIYLNRPEEMNSLSKKMTMEILQALEEIEQDDDIRVVILSGKGKAFCAGADLKELLRDLNKDPDGEKGILDYAEELFRKLNYLSKPLIVALNGVTLAGGLELAMTADIVVASEKTKIGDGHANFGVLPGGGGAVRLHKEIGINRAKYLLFTGDMFPAKEWKDYGFVHEVVPAEELNETAQKIADKVAAKSPLVLREMKRLVRDSADQKLDTSLRQELLSLKNHTHSYDFSEGLSAFSEKRTPEFKGY